MSDDPTSRLREKTMQIAALNQRLETLQLQLSGSVKRASQLNQQVQQLEQAISQKDSEIMQLKEELRKAQGALRAMGEEVRDMRADQPTAGAPVRRVDPAVAEAQEQLGIARRRVRDLEDHLAKMSAAAMDVISGKEQSVEALKTVLLEHGSPRYRILGLVLQKRKIKIDDLAAMLNMGTAEIRGIIDKMQTEGELELGQNNVVMPAKKYREAQIPVEKWEQSPPDKIFDDLEQIVGRTEGHESVAKALETAVDILEQKLARGGALIFEMRRMAGSWKSSAGDVQELQYKIRQWKSRAQSMS